MDNRQIVKQRKYPYSAIGCLIALYGHPKIYRCFGTASIIYKNFILTCAHNVYDRHQREKTNGAIFIPFLAGGTGIRFNIDPTKIYYPKQYEDPSLSQRKAFEYDYCVIQVETEDFSQQYGCLGLNQMISADNSAMIYGYTDNYTIQYIRKAKQQATNKKQKRNLSQYPKCSLINLYGEYGQHKWQWGTSGIVNQYQNNPKFIVYKIPTNKGQSGSPILRKMGKSNYQIIGIHQRALDSVNSGIKLSVCKDFINSIIKPKKVQIAIKCQSFNEESFRQFTQTIYNWYWKQLTNMSLIQTKITSQMIAQFSSLGKMYQKLTQLNLSHNGINAKGIKNLTANKNTFPVLQILILNNNQIRSQGVKLLIENHQCFPMLNGLFVQNNFLDQSAIKYLTHKTRKKQKSVFPFLDKLQLANNYKSKPGCKSLGMILEKFPNLTYLGLRSNFLRDKGLSYLSDNEEKLAQVTHLCLGHNFITDISEIAKSTKKGFLNLTALYLEQNQLDEKSLQCLSHTINFPSLVELQLFSNNLGSKSILALFKTEDCFPHLQILGLHNNNLGKQGCAYLSYKHKATPKLKQLNLSKNNIGDEGIQRLKQNKHIFPNLICLKLTDNNLTSVSVKYLMSGHKQFGQLQILQLGTNRIGDQGIYIFCEQPGVDKIFANLKVWNISNNSITSQGFVMLLKNGLKLKKIRTLELSQNKIDRQGTQFLESMKQEKAIQISGLNDIILQGNNLNRENINSLKYFFPNLNFGFHK